ncbi:uncharacterized protein LOC107640607 [Arachis ipaensis]|uniref:uncharacterized protein LOC107640607 n=1 Tax=Arachis ipaensis TaxID=130454 RepID=UPI0007AF1F29|nr:uncharacterized protein LOC107640607 [Arachis ipaensis]
MARMEAMLANLCKEVEDIKKFKEEERVNMSSRGAALKNLESQVGYQSQKIPKSTDSFPSDTEKNPREGTQKVTWEECKAVSLASEEVREEEFEQRNETAQERESQEKQDLQPYVPQAPFPQRLRRDMFASLSVNIPYLEVLKQMPTFVKWMKELLARKSNLRGGQTVVMNKECSALIQKDLLLKKKDPGSFHIPCIIGETKIDRGFCDLVASINVMPLSLMKKLQVHEVKSTNIIIQLADKTQKQAEEIVENVLVKVGNYYLPTYFVVLDMEESYLHPTILGRPFLATGRSLIDVEQGELILSVHDE